VFPSSAIQTRTANATLLSCQLATARPSFSDANHRLAFHSVLAHRAAGAMGDAFLAVRTLCSRKELVNPACIWTT
jgi:hypothetical protein